ncbi:MAG TPA: hypothetical protein VIJ46_03260, partial [Rhabdochlamydiaceae bacterium]
MLLRSLAASRLLFAAVLVPAISGNLPGQIGAGTPGIPQTSTAKRLQIESFEAVWTTIRDKHWDPHPGGLDWNKIHDEYRPLIDHAATDKEARTITRAMLARLKQT